MVLPCKQNRIVCSTQQARCIDLCANMTHYGLMKTITISAFKAHLSAELRKVRRGGRVVISDRDTPIAEVVPFRGEDTPTLGIRLPDAVPFEIPRSSLRIEHDPVAYLLEDRARR